MKIILSFLLFFIFVPGHALSANASERYFDFKEPLLVEGSISAYYDRKHPEKEIARIGLETKNYWESMSGFSDCYSLSQGFLYGVAEYKKKCQELIKKNNGYAAYYLAESLFINSKGENNDDLYNSIGYYHLAAELGVEEAQVKLARVYDYGIERTYLSRNPGQAFLWYRDVAVHGRNRAAIYRLAQIYENGEGALQDIKLAVKWYKKSALLGLPEAQYKLAAVYYDGSYVKKDLVQAYAWLNILVATVTSKSKYKYGKQYEVYHDESDINEMKKFRDEVLSGLSNEERIQSQALANELYKTINVSLGDM